MDWQQQSQELCDEKKLVKGAWEKKVENAKVQFAGKLVTKFEAFQLGIVS